MFAILLAAALADAQPAPVQIPEGAALTQAIAARDDEFFALFFSGCDPARLATMVAGDLEFYHDRGGVVARSGAALVANYEKQCEARKAPDAWRSRRELVRASLHVDPVPGYGAIEDGEHLFYERQGDGPERLAGRARFTQLWVLSPDGWRLSRVLSYAHRKAE
ncbi:nuclear transport factor 2 family protein [Allosphingosinicella flava]|uniref:Nuclear transport factor 2 family protein n=1 Tax=Allosphingosinicella flava TaxID=2771430 RepID=A0A7T2LL78_9SPHN|nr:nuclear transport factor 2 family protein [Sphingosinicella flava]QPQ54235.1 nuclear transport factor 2 family protein [Sphingosinicella flava]